LRFQSSRSQEKTRQNKERELCRTLVAFFGIHDSKGRFGIARIKLHEAKRLVLGVAYEPDANLNFTGTLGFCLRGLEDEGR
jgi:hypothetical protein